MKQIKFLVTILALFAIMTQGQAQVNKITEKAKERVDKINNAIAAEDASLKLSGAQIKEAINVQEMWLKEARAARQGETDKVKAKAKVKAISQKYNKEIMTDILTKEQRLAFRAGKEKLKSKE